MTNLEEGETYPSAGSHVEILSMHEWTEGGHEVNKPPKCGDNAVKYPRW